jgi:hypothetical protein
VAKVHREEKACQAAMFLAGINDDFYDMYTTTEFEAEEQRADSEKLMEAFEILCVSELNVVCERYVFNRRQQDICDKFDTFLADSRRLVCSCEYGTVEESIIRDRIVLGIQDDAT